MLASPLPSLSPPASPPPSSPPPPPPPPPSHAYHHAASLDLTRPSASARLLIAALLTVRSLARARRDFLLSDALLRLLEAHAVHVDDKRRQWHLAAPPRRPSPPLPPDAPRCTLCLLAFPSRNALFRHLRDPRAPCASPLAPPPRPAAPPLPPPRPPRPPRRRRVEAARCLWLGALPADWACARRLQLLLWRLAPRGVPPPWLKAIVRRPRRGLPYAIAAFRDAAEAEEARGAMDGAWVDGGGFEAELGGAEASSFTLAVRKCEHSDGGGGEGEGEEEGEEEEAGVDPPLVEQLRPLAASELMRRVEAGEAAARGKGELLQQVARACGGEGRRVTRWRGHPLPPRLAAALLHELRGLRWPAKSQRDELTSEHYLVLKPAAAAEGDCSYATLRRLCAEVMAFAEPEYKYSGVAVTHNFVGSPHIDHCDTTYQFALALGDFEGGELCVEQDEQTVCAVDTKGRIACVDGRFVHWVRTHRGGDRFSLIFYDTTGARPRSRGLAVNTSWVPFGAS